MLCLLRFVLKTLYILMKYGSLLFCQGELFLEAFDLLVGRLLLVAEMLGFDYGNGLGRSFVLPQCLD